MTLSLQLLGHAWFVRFAVPGNDPRLVGLVRRYDRDGVSMAETWRAVGARASRLGFRRPGYGLVRQLVRLERIRRRVRNETLAALKKAASGFAAGRVPVRPLLADLERVGWRKGLVFDPREPP
ncbi:MAG: hypothetical protein MSC30_08330 [Gaiellaceae bacterium MAG52_C11]|nr:hypothetical protein [Candidatus Gaiellasilicea maunaloa]